MSEHELQIHPVQVIPKIQGMFCEMAGRGTIQCTVTMSDVSLTVYSKVNLFTFDDDKIAASFRRLSHYVTETSLSKADFEQDFKDLLYICSKVNKTELYVGGQTLLTYVIGEPVLDENTGYAYVTPRCKEWWSHPRLEPIVNSIKIYFPDFEPWKLQKDKYLGMLSSKSTLI